MAKQRMTDEEFEEYFDKDGDTTAFTVPGSIRFPSSQEGTMTEASQTDDARFDAFAAFVSQSTVDVEWSDEFDDDYKALIGKKRLQDYESLA